MAAATLLLPSAWTPSVIITWPPKPVVRRLSLSARMRCVFSERTMESSVSLPRSNEVRRRSARPRHVLINYTAEVTACYEMVGLLGDVFGGKFCRMAYIVIRTIRGRQYPVSYTHLRAHETG